RRSVGGSTSHPIMAPSSPAAPALCVGSCHRTPPQALAIGLSSDPSEPPTRGHRPSAAATALRTGQIIPWVVPGEREPICGFDERWERACRLVGGGHRVPDDFRRTATRSWPLS